MRKLALITGGTSGIGFGIASHLALECDLALVYARDDEKAKRALDSLRELSPEAKVFAYARPLQSQTDCAALYDQVISDFERAPNILVNSAGRIQDGLVIGSDFSASKSVIDEHLIVTMALSQIAAKKMYQCKWGRILNLSSISSFYAKRGQANYAAAKAGIEAFTRTFALEVAHRGVTVNAIAPGLIDTPMTGALVASIKEKGEPIRNRIPVGRLGTPDEVGALAKFLCSEDASYMTGITITIDGGRSLGDPLS